MTAAWHGIGWWASVAALSLGAMLLGAPFARAQAAPQMQVGVDQDTVGVGSILHMQLTAQSADAAPDDPKPGATPGFLVTGQSASPSQTHMIINGARSDRYGLTVDWALQAQRTGSFTLGPPSVVIGGVRYSSRALTVKVVPAGQAPPPRQQQPQSPFGFSPFDPWKNLFPPGFDQPDQQLPPQAPPVTVDPRLGMDVPRGAVFFLHAAVDKTSAVVGEQVTFSVYAYIDATATVAEIDDSDNHDPSVADFVKHPLAREDQEPAFVGYASIGGNLWKVKLMRRWALFPLRAGDLEIGPMNMTLARPRSAAGKRNTETLRVHVTEPPIVGRPPGYAIGDVGHFNVSAVVSPRETDEGGAVGVHVELSGTGNVPSTITPPARAGLEWLVPEVHEELGPVGHDAFGGKRTFDFVVRVRKAGDVDLGEIALPFWNPEQKRYEIARAALGAVHARPSSVAAAGGAGADHDEALPGLPPARDSLEGERPRRAHLSDSPWFWALGVGAWPLAFGVAVAGSSVARRARDRWRVRRTSPAANLKERVAAASRACGGNDARTADAAIARALEAATIAHAGISVRGAIGDEVVERLESAGVSRDAAASVAELLRECETARFAPDTADVIAARDRWVRAQGAIRQLARRG
jgi:hypothetical protein